MQDNTRIHTVKKVQEWFKNNKIPVLDWAPYSPDMNPIKHVWKKLKELIHQQHPELINIGQSEEDLYKLSRAIINTWDSIPQTWIDNLIDSMPRRIEALRRVKGWHTKY
jgi:transposase